MAAAISAARCGAKAVLLEQNEKTGKKLFITGKGRCNLVNDCDTADFFDSVVSNPRFLYSAVYGYDHDAVKSFFESCGVPLKTERGGRVFPRSDHSSDILRALDEEMERLGVSVRLHSRVKEVLYQDGQAAGVLLSDGEKIPADAVIIATGGLSYPSTGSTGDGYRLAREAGHSIVPCVPSLVPFAVEEEEYHGLMGLSLRNVELTFYQGGKKLDSFFGEMLFTHYGISGPIVLTASARLARRLEKGPMEARLDLKPALSEKQLDQRICRDFEKYANRDFANSLSDLLPAKMIPLAIEKSGISPHEKVHDITKEQRKKLTALLKGLPMTMKRTGPYTEAVVTKGGVSTKEIDSSTMESKKKKGLYFAGEVIDVDAYTGGYNLQIAWSTGHLAGESAAMEG